jgi:hyperosmotically inducible periplasmic protein
MRVKHAFGTLAVLACLSGGVSAPVAAQEERKPDADNTRTNRRDRSNTEPTADQAKNNTSDRELMQKIRRALMDDKSLSTYAHNVKVIAQSGKVTLKGPVHSEEEKRVIEQKATDIAGEGNVTSEITVKAARSKRSS